MIIFFYGDDQFRSHQKLLEIKDKYLKSDKSGSGLSSFDFEDRAFVKDIIDVCSMPNLLAPKRLVMIKRIIRNGLEGEQKIMLEYLEKNKKSLEEDEDLVIVFWEENISKKTNKLFKLLGTLDKKQEFEKLAGVKLDSWILKRIKELDVGANISKTALEKLIAYCGNETLILNTELQKLVNYVNGRMISDQDIEILVRANIDANIFATIETLASGNKKQALKFLHDHLSKGDDPFYIMSMFIYQFRNLLKVADLAEKRIPEYEIAKLTKMHPFVVRKSLRQIRDFTFARLKGIYNKLLDIDVKVKTGKMDMKLALDVFIVEI